MEIIEDDYEDEKVIPEIKRTACRGIVFKKDKVLMIYCRYFNDYSFPGGGVEENESLDECLKRELREEGGVIVDSIQLLTYVDEKRYSVLNPNLRMSQRNYYYLCNLVKETDTKLEAYEIEFGYEKAFISIDDAIGHNEKALQNIENLRNQYLEISKAEKPEKKLIDLRKIGTTTAIKRELYILNLLKEKRE